MTERVIQVRNKGDKSAEVLIYDQIGEDWWTGEGVTAKRFVADLKALGAVDNINVRINSPGGSVFDGVAIHNALARHGARIVVDIDGIALSAASFVAMAGHEIRIAENAQMMIHNPYTVAGGDAGQLRKAAEVLDSVKASIVTTYTARTKLDAEHVSALMDAETWWVGREAVAAGFADAVTAPVEITNVFDLSRFRNAPKAKASKPHITAAEIAARNRIAVIADRVRRHAGAGA